MEKNSWDIQDFKFKFNARAEKIWDGKGLGIEYRLKISEEFINVSKKGRKREIEMAEEKITNWN